jgi:hypothetical protein
MVAVPKNQAITMLLGGSIGYDPASDVSVKNGVITLSAGRNLFGTFFSDEVGPTELDANIRFDGGTVTSDLDARSRGSTVIASNATAFTASGDVRLLGRSSTELIADGPNALISIGGRLQGAAYSDTTGAAGTVRIAALGGGSVSVAQTTTLRTDSLGVFGRPSGAPPILTGGTAIIEANGGSISFGSNVTLAADGYLESGTGNQFGGTASVRSLSGGTINVNGNLTVQATTANFAAATGNTQGGTASVLADGGQIGVSGGLEINASAFGAFGGGNGTGGTASLRVANSGTVSANTASIQAFGGGRGATGAGVGFAGTGGTVDVDAQSGGMLSVTGQLYAEAGGNGATEGLQREACNCR